MNLLNQQTLRSTPSRQSWSFLTDGPFYSWFTLLHPLPIEPAFKIETFWFISKQQTPKTSSKTIIARYKSFTLSLNIARSDLPLKKQPKSNDINCILPCRIVLFCIWNAIVTLHCRWLSCTINSIADSLNQLWYRGHEKVKFRLCCRIDFWQFSMSMLEE